MTAPVEFVLLVAVPPADPVAACARRFARAALAEGHRVPLIFFQAEGVYHGLPASALAEEGDAGAELVALAAQGVDLVLCAGAAARRGIGAAGLPAGMRIAGVGGLIAAMSCAGRVLTFGG